MAPSTAKARRARRLDMTTCIDGEEMNPGRAASLAGGLLEPFARNLARYGAGKMAALSGDDEEKAALRAGERNP